MFFHPFSRHLASAFIKIRRNAIGPFGAGLVLLLLISAGVDASAAMIKGPYLLFPGKNTQMRVLWQLDTATTCSLRWGRTRAYADGTTVTSEANPTTHQHLCALGGLTPGTQYYYQVSEGSTTHEGSFRSAPTSLARSVKFMVYGDTRSQPSVHDATAKTMQDVVAGDPDYQTFVLHVGDWVGGDSEGEWQNEFFTPTAPNLQAMLSSLPIQGCMGNHEGYGVYLRQYWPYPYVTPLFYGSFDYGPVHVAVINQYDYSNGPNAEQMEWLKNDLAATDRPWKFLIYHEPAWTAQNIYHPDNANAQMLLQPLCKQYGIVMCFSGHVHLYAHCLVDGVHHMTVGSGAAPLYTPNDTQPDYVLKAVATYHFAKVEIVDNGLNFTAVQNDGTVLESFHVQLPQATSAGPESLKYR